MSGFLPERSRTGRGGELRSLRETLFRSWALNGIFVVGLVGPTPMDNLDLEYLLEQTQVLRSQEIQPSITEARVILFSVIYEDMDSIGVVHIQEGTLYFRKLQELDISSEGVLEGFGTAAQEAFEALRQHIRVFEGGVGLGTRPGDRHEVHGSLAAVRDRIEAYPANQKRLIVQTLQDGWEVALLWAAMASLCPPKL